MLPPCVSQLFLSRQIFHRVRRVISPCVGRRYTESGTADGNPALPHPGIGREVKLRAEARRRKGLDRLFSRPEEVLTRPHEAFAMLVGSGGGGGGGGGVTRAEFCQVCCLLRWPWLLLLIPVLRASLVLDAIWASKRVPF